MKLFRGYEYDSTKWFTHRAEWRFEKFISIKSVHLHTQAHGAIWGDILVDDSINMVYTFKRYWIALFDKNEIVTYNGEHYVVLESNIAGVVLIGPAGLIEVETLNAHYIRRVDFADLSSDDKGWVVLYLLEHS